MRKYAASVGYTELVAKTNFAIDTSYYLPYEAAFTDSDGLIRPCLLAIRQTEGGWHIVHLMDAHLSMIDAEMEISFRRGSHRYRVVFPDWTIGTIELRKPLSSDRLTQRFKARFRECNPRIEHAKIFQQCIESIEGQAENNGHPLVLHTHHGRIREYGNPNLNSTTEKIYDKSGMLIYDPNQRENITDARDWKRRKLATAFRAERGLKPLGRS